MPVLRSTKSAHTLDGFAQRVVAELCGRGKALNYPEPHGVHRADATRQRRSPQAAALPSAAYGRTGWESWNEVRRKAPVDEEGSRRIYL